MPRVRIQEAAALRLDEIHRYSRKRGGDAQAERYLKELLAAFDGIVTGKTMSQPIPAELGVTGYFFRHQRHVVYWRRLSNGDVGNATVLHARLHPMDRLREDLQGG